MTDHNSYTTQAPWCDIRADRIVVPDSKAQLLVQNELKYWQRIQRIPAHDRDTQVDVIPYPIDPDLSQPASAEMIADRNKQLMGESQLKILWSMGGVVPNMEKSQELLGHLQQIEGVHCRALIKKNGHNNHWIDNLIDQGIDIVKLLQNQAAVGKFTQDCVQFNPAVKLMKPCELTVLNAMSSEFVGGGPVGLLKPVQQQERDNLQFYREKGLIPEVDTNQALIYSLLNGGGEEFLEIAHNWGGVELPEEPELTTRIINLMWKKKLWLAMSESKGKNNDPELALNGPKQFWEYLNTLLGEFVVN
jgi:hypothetical protein